MVSSLQAAGPSGELFRKGLPLGPCSCGRRSCVPRLRKGLGGGIVDGTGFEVGATCTYLKSLKVELLFACGLDGWSRVHILKPNGGLSKLGLRGSSHGDFSVTIRWRRGRVTMLLADVLGRVLGRSIGALAAKFESCRYGLTSGVLYVIERGPEVSGAIGGVGMRLQSALIKLGG